MLGVDRIRRDFDEIARLGDHDDGASSRYDSFLLSLIPPDARHILDVGCGAGRLTSMLVRPGRDVVGVDLSTEMIVHARERAPGARFVCGDFLALDFPSRSFDCVVTAATLHHMPLERAVARLRELLRPGGRLIIHDLRATDDVFDELRALLAASCHAVLRLLRTGRPSAPRRVRRAWSRHVAGETYLTAGEARAAFARYLPGGRFCSHWCWRYTLAWDSPRGRRELH